MIENITKFRILDGALQYFTFKGIWKYLLTVNELEAIRNASLPSNANVIATVNDIDEATSSVNLTYSEMGDLIDDAQLKPYLLYKITDRGDNGLVFRAAAVDRLESTGLRYMLCPATYATGLDAYDNDWIGVWNATKQATATEGQLTIWNGLVWTAGATLSGDSPDTEASGWVVIPKASFSNHEYVEMIFNVCYDFDNDWIEKQWDNKGNIVGLDLLRGQEYLDNVANLTDWNTNVLFVNNVCFSVYNNSNNGNIYDNRCYGGSISGNSNNGDISNNNIGGNIIDNSNNGFVADNSNKFDIYSNSSLPATTCNIQSNTNDGSITGVWDADVTDAVVDKTGTATP